MYLIFRTNIGQPSFKKSTPENNSLITPKIYDLGLDLIIKNCSDVSNKLVAKIEKSRLICQDYEKRMQFSRNITQKLKSELIELDLKHQNLEKELNNDNQKKLYANEYKSKKNLKF